MIQIILTRNELRFDKKDWTIDEINSVDQFYPTLKQAISLADVIVYRDDVTGQFKVLKHHLEEMVGETYHMSHIKNILFKKEV